MRLVNFTAEATNYREALDDFVSRNNLPRTWFEDFDHLAFKAFNPEDYEQLVEHFIAMSNEVVEVEIDGRRIASAYLLGQFSVDMALTGNPKTFVD